MLHDLRDLAAVAVTAFIAGLFGYIGWDCARTLIVWVLNTWR